jgi:DNA-binding transcriptional LysR family regulator
MSIGRNDLADLAAFATLAEERSFTRAAARLGVSQSALSHAMRKLEEKLGVRLLTRTTRSVATTQAGERLLATLGPALDQIHYGIEDITRLRDKPAGTIRITTSEHAARTVLWPALERILPVIPTSMSKSASTTASSISWRNASTPAFAWARQSPAT